MTRRVKLLHAVRKHIINELVNHCSTLSIPQLNNRMDALDKITKRLPHITQPKPRISSQRKLFF